MTPRNDRENWIEIARAGTFRDAQGEWHRFSLPRLEKIAASYDPKHNQAPLVIGHPALNGPAHGWIESLKINGEKLLAKPAYVTAEIKRAVDNGLYKYVSMSLYQDDRLRHVGILGGHPPAIDDLAPISFAGEAALTLDFGGHHEPDLENPEPKGKPMTIEELLQEKAELMAKLETVTKERDAALKEAAALKETLGQTKTEAEKTSADFAAYRDLKEKEFLTGRFDKLVGDGKVSPAERPILEKTAEHIRRAGHLDFADSGGEKPLDDFLSTLEKRPVTALFNNFSAPPAGEEPAPNSKPLSAKL